MSGHDQACNAHSGARYIIAPGKGLVPQLSVYALDVSRVGRGLCSPEEGSADPGGTSSWLSVPQGALDSAQAQRLMRLSRQTGEPGGSPKHSCSCAHLNGITQGSSRAMHLQAADAGSMQACILQCQAHNLQRSTLFTLSRKSAACVSRSCLLRGCPQVDQHNRIEQLD